MENIFLPDDVIASILKFSSPPTLAKARRVSRRVNKIIDRHRLGKTKVDELSIELRKVAERSAPFGKLQLKPSTSTKDHLVVTVRKKAKSHRILQEVIDCSDRCNEIIGDVIDKVFVGNRLSFDGVQVDEHFLQSFSTKHQDFSSVSNVTFTLSRLEISVSEMLSFLARTSVDSLTFDFCHLRNDIVSDKVLMALEKLVCLRVQPRRILPLPGLTDATLEYWIATQQPQTISLYNSITACTLKGIVELIQNHIQTNKESHVDWDFGSIWPTPQSADYLTQLTLMHGVHIGVSDDFHSRRIEITAANSKITFNLLDNPVMT